MSTDMKAKLEWWEAWSSPPPEALKAIGGGRLKGMTDINPVWRSKALTERFGPCGTGWSYRIDKLWREDGHGGEVFAFAQVTLIIEGGEIPGIGGSMLIASESKGMHNNDEAYKMAVTDALSVACKHLGIGADIYWQRGGDSKYAKPQPSEDKPAPKGRW